MCVLKKLLWSEFGQSIFDFERVFSLCQAGAVCNAKNMRVYGDRWFTKRSIENDVRGFSADPGQRLECCAGSRNFTIVFIQQYSTGLDDVLCLAVEQADGLYVRLQFANAKVKDRRGCVGNGVEQVGCLVDTDVRGLC